MSQQYKIGKTATQVYSQGMKKIVEYYQTNVVVFDDKNIILNSGGWMTATTKLRMNQAANQFNLGFRVYQKKGEWFVCIGDKMEKEAKFYDNMVIDRKGGVNSFTA